MLESIEEESVDANGALGAEGKEIDRTEGSVDGV